MPAVFGQDKITEVSSASRVPSRSNAELAPDRGQFDPLDLPLGGAGTLAPVASYGPEQTFGPYGELDFTLDRKEKTFWCCMHPKTVPSFTPTLLGELISMGRSIRGLFSSSALDEAPIQYFVGGSRLPRIYNLGGDLGYFAQCIRAGDRAALTRYAYDCVDVGYHMYVGFNVPVITIALVQGDALGGGFEGALSFNVLVAERSAKFGFPEILFNLFPGMGAYSFLSRKLGSARAERMIMSGHIYTAGQLHEMGLIDVLADDGKGEDAVRDYIARNARRHAAHHGIYRARRRVNLLSCEELRDITDIWVDTALKLSPMDLRKMERLMTAQLRRLADRTASSDSAA